VKGLVEGSELVEDVGGREDSLGFGRSRRGGARGSWREPDAADVEIFFEAIELQEVGEFECSMYWRASAGSKAANSRQ
jgi:hypothetical protein